MSDAQDKQILEKLRKELFLTRIFSIISSLILIYLVVFGVVLFFKYQESKEHIIGYILQLQTYTEGLAKDDKNQSDTIDIEAYNKALTNLNEVIETVDWAMLNNSIESVDWKMLNDSIAGVDWKMLSDNIAGVDWKRLSDNIASVDWEKVSEQLAALDVEAINEVIEELDTKELSLALANMNSAVEKLKGIIELLGNLASKWGLEIGK